MLALESQGNQNTGRLGVLGVGCLLLNIFHDLSASERKTYFFVDPFRSHQGLILPLLNPSPLNWEQLGLSEKNRIYRIKILWKGNVFKVSQK